MVGAVVVIATAVILIPPMLSGTKSTSQTTADSAAVGVAATQSDEVARLKTYTIDLSKTGMNPAPQESRTIAPAATESVRPTSEQVIASIAPPPEESAPDVRASSAKSDPAKSGVQPSAKLSVPASSQSDQRRDTTSKLPSPVIATQTDAPNAAALNQAGSWSVQVGSFGVRATSERVAADLKREGFSAFVVAFQAGNQTMYRVRVGPERDRASAEGLLRKLKIHHPGAALVPPT
jgi:DedD protein